jgi:hypothetical protein
MKSVPVSQCVLTALAHRCQDQEAAVHFIALARQALPGQPSWQESVTAVEVPMIMKLHRRLNVCWTDASGHTQQATLHCAAVTELRAEEANPVWDQGVPNHVVVPPFWHPPRWDAVHYLSCLRRWSVFLLANHAGPPPPALSSR